MKNQVTQNILHWLLVTSGFLAVITSFSGWVHWIPGRIGQVVSAAFVLIFAIERLLIVLESVLEGKRSAEDAAGEVVKDVQTISADVQSLAKTAEPFIKNAPK